jgi:hypothetical protein
MPLCAAPSRAAPDAENAHQDAKLAPQEMAGPSCSADKVAQHGHFQVNAHDYVSSGPRFLNAWSGSCGMERSKDSPLISI